VTDWQETKEEAGREIVRRMFDAGCIRTWRRHRPEGWMLRSGTWSPFYIQLRTLASHPGLLARVGQALAGLVRQEIDRCDRVVGVAMTGVPIATAVALEAGLPLAYTRKLSQDTDIESYGQHALVEGELEAGDRLALVDDVITRFDSKLEALRQIAVEAERRKLEGVICRDVVVVLDRGQGAAEVARQRGVAIHALIPFVSRGVDWLGDRLDPVEDRVLRVYLEDPAPFQDADRRPELLRG